MRARGAAERGSASVRPPPGGGSGLEAGRCGREVRSLNPGLVIGGRSSTTFQYPALMARRTHRAQEPELFWRGRGVGGSLDDQRDPGDPTRCPRTTTGGACRAGRGTTCCRTYRRLETEHDFGPTILARHRWADADLPDPAGTVGRGRRRALRRGRSPPATDGAPITTLRRAEGVSPYAINGDPVREERVTTNDAYLEPARDRPNLRIVGDALVDRVLIEGGTAVGVRVRLDGGVDDDRGRARSCSARARCTRRRSCCARASGRGLVDRPARGRAPAGPSSRVRGGAAAHRGAAARRPSTATRTCACGTRRGSPAPVATT